MTKDASGADSPRLRVLLSMATLVPGAMGGSETYARALVPALASRSDVDVQVIVPTSVTGLAAGLPEHLTRDVAGAAASHRLHNLMRLLTTGRFRSLIRAASVVHYPFTVPVPRPAGTPWVTSLLDVQHLDLPHMFTGAERAYRAVLYDTAAKRADAVITISTHAKGRMVDALGLDPDRVHVAHLGVDATAFEPNLDVRDDFVLYPARGWPHKNHSTLLRAMDIVRRRRQLSLVLTGGGLQSLGSLPDWVSVRGLVSVGELRRLYRRAACLAFPSLYEGFGLPPLEAMASGCPVAASAIPVIAEVGGDAAELFDPKDPESMAAAIVRAVETYPAKAALGLSRAREFTWERCAEVHVGAYRRAASVS